MILLEIIISLAFVFFLLSTFVSGINEVFAMLLNKRGRELKRALDLAFEQTDPEMIRNFYDHPLVSQLKETPKGDSIRGLALHIINFFRRDKYEHTFLPSYIDRKTFSTAITDILVLGKDLRTEKDPKEIEYTKEMYLMVESLDQNNYMSFEAFYLASPYQHPLAIEVWNQWKQDLDTGLPFPDAKRNVLLLLSRKIENNQMSRDSSAYFEKLKTLQMTKSGVLNKDYFDMLTLQSETLRDWYFNLEKQFDAYMDRVSGWYKKRSSTNIFWWSVVLVVFLNIDTIALTKALYQSEHLREYAVSQASAVTAKTPDDMTKQSLQLFKPFLQVSREWNFKNVFAWIPGWIVTILAISFGAPFWFDVMSRSVRVRATGAKPESDNQQSTTNSR